jgi:hypothetical protein
MSRTSKAAQWFGVQYRSMHTAIHNVVVFETREVAQTLGEMLNAEVDMAEAQDVLVMQYGKEAGEAKASFEINYRNPPTEYREQVLLIVNDAIPDVY